ncbi:MAG TPA: hypothetical protein DIW61_04795 [Candidatus Aminicenantes bacterium]|nr:hypothetical protein [Candidatus Aminicenantes bacterium]
MKKLIIITALFLFSVGLSLAQTGEDEPKYTNESFARLSHISGSVYIQKGAEQGFEDGVVNMPIEEGDRLGTTDGRAELYLGKKTYVRLDNNTKLEIMSLPKKGSDLTRLRVLKGNIYLSVNRLDEEKTVEVHTPDASFYVLDEGLYRIDVLENRKTDIYVFRGVVEAAGEEGSLLLKSEQSIAVAEGRYNGRPVRFLAVAEDTFDRWSEDRESRLAVQVAARRLPGEIEDFEAELEESGDWSWINPYGWVWVPGGVGPDWRPYYNGSWMWMSMGGWTWLPYDPWGWVTFHYGRWGWYGGLGWYWIPGSIWGPGWVGWWWGADYYAWAPLGWWNYPMVIVDNWYYPNWTRPYYPYNSRALTVIHKDQLRAKDISRAALRGDSLKNFDKITLTGQGRALKPASGQGITKNAGGAPAAGAERIIKAPAVKGVEPKTPPTVRSADKSGQAGGISSGERKIRSKDSPQAQGSDTPRKQSGSTVRKYSFGYPPSPAISIKKYLDRSGTSSSIRNRFYQSLGKSGSSSKSSSKSGSVSRGSSSSGSQGSKGSVSSGSRGSSSGSRSSGGSRPSGGVRKKG